MRANIVAIAIFSLVLSAAADPKAIPESKTNVCSSGFTSIVVYQAMWCSECIAVRETLSQYAEEYGLVWMEYVVEDKKGKPDRELKKRLAGMVGGVNNIFYPYIIICDDALPIAEDMDVSLREALNLPKREARQKK